MNHPKLKLLNIETNEILTYADEEISFGGPWGWLQQEGKAVWQLNEIPVDQLKSDKIADLRSIANAKLQPTDYKALKYAEGWLTDDEYSPVKAERQAIRDRCNELENKVIASTTQAEIGNIVWE